MSSKCIYLCRRKAIVAVTCIYLYVKRVFKLLSALSFCPNIKLKNSINFVLFSRHGEIGAKVIDIMYTFYIFFFHTILILMCIPHKHCPLGNVQTKTIVGTAIATSAFVAGVLAYAYKTLTADAQPKK